MLAIKKKIIEYTFNNLSYSATFFNTIFTIWVNWAALYTASGVGAFQTACQYQYLTLDPWDLKSKFRINLIISKTIL